MIFRGFLIFALIAFVEIYFFQAVKTLTQDLVPARKNLIHTIYWSITAVILIVGIVAVFYPPPLWNKYLRTYLASFVLILAVVKILGCVFLLLDDVVRLFRWIWERFSSSNSGENGISRLKFFSWLALGFSTVPLLSFMYGIVRGGYKFRVHNVKISNPGIPEAFNGLKIVQLSDMHVGSYTNTDALEKVFSIVADLKPDLVFFTGDLVNVQTDETDGFLQTFQKLKAPMGVYSVLGNHDYGDYREWNSASEKIENLEALKNVHAEAGWRLLMNENLKIEKNGEFIQLLGVENWGANLHFKKYGRMDLAVKNADENLFTILLSHDPSHWNKEVRIQYPFVDLTLSGHTHGFQFGIEIPGFKWSPVQYVYPQWAGLYQDDKQMLYVNRGLGFVGYPGRLGIWPEITLLELQKA